MRLTAESQERLERVWSDFSNGTLSGLDQIFEAFYPELKRLAASKMRREAVDHTLQPTALVNELYLELIKVNALRGVKPGDSRQRSAFFALAGQVMRWLLIRHTRRLSWHAKPVEVPLTLADSEPSIAGLLEVESILKELAAIDLQLRTVVELRVFEGLSIEECSQRLGCSVSTITRNWRYAKLWLRNRLDNDGSTESQLTEVV